MSGIWCEQVPFRSSDQERCPDLTGVCTCRWLALWCLSSATMPPPVQTGHPNSKGTFLRLSLVQKTNFAHLSRLFTVHATLILTHDIFYLPCLNLRTILYWKDLFPIFTLEEIKYIFILFILLIFIYLSVPSFASIWKEPMTEWRMGFFC